MPGFGDTFKTDQCDQRIWLVVLAAPREFQAAATSFGIADTRPKPWTLIPTSFGVDLVLSGVGKANASGAVARVLDPDRHLGVLSAGIAGALPGEVGCRIGDVICASESVFGDEGVRTPDGFESCAQIGFGAFRDGTDSITHDPRVVDWLGGYADHVGPIACVSMCSGTDSAAKEIAERTGAIAEAMEGAGTALSAHRIDPAILTGELRVISNTTGDRDAQQWDLDRSLDRLEKVLGRIAQRVD